MIDWFVWFYTYFIPWWVWIFVALGAGFFIWRYIGLEWAIAFLAACAIAMAHRRGEQKGYRDREKQAEKDADRHIARAESAGRDADQFNASLDNLRKDDGWRREK